MGKNSGPRKRLIAVDGCSGRELNAAAESLRRRFCLDHTESGISHWDASGIFYYLEHHDQHQRPSARTLILLYAADLAFRIRWQIRPALEHGQVVVAAPYVASALALGRAAGLPARWLDNLFRLAPKPDVSYRTHESGHFSAVRIDPGDGYVEFCCTLLQASPVYHDIQKIRGRVLHCLDEQECKGVCRKIPRSWLSPHSTTKTPTRVESAKEAKTAKIF